MFLILDFILFLLIVTVKFMEKTRKAQQDKEEHPSIPESPILKVAKTIRYRGSKVAPAKKENGFQDKVILDAFTRCRNGTQTNIRLKFEELSLTLPSGVTILNGVSGEIAPGKFTAIMGPSGAGSRTELT